MIIIANDNIKNNKVFIKNLKVEIEGNWCFLEFIKYNTEGSVAKYSQKFMSQEVRVIVFEGVLGMKNAKVIHKWCKKTYTFNKCFCSLFAK